jgi:hypothetical protein
VATNAQLLYSEQTLFGPIGAKLICGYQLDVIQTGITDIAITCPKGSKVEWLYSIKGQGDDEAGTGIKLTPQTPQDGQTDTRFRTPGDDGQENKENA